MTRLRAAAARALAAATAAARRAVARHGSLGVCVPPLILGPLLPWTPPPPPRTVGPWRPRIRPELRTVRERIIIAYALADLPVAAVLAVHGWQIGAVL